MSHTIRNTTRSQGSTPPHQLALPPKASHTQRVFAVTLQTPTLQPLPCPWSSLSQPTSIAALWGRVGKQHSFAKRPPLLHLALQKSLEPGTPNSKNPIPNPSLHTAMSSAVKRKGFKAGFYSIPARKRGTEEGIKTNNNKKYLDVHY